MRHQPLMADDYYKTLGVSKTASADEIRKAYRKLARVNHPDAKPNDPKAAETFKKIQEAYDVLNDTEKRQQYDQFGADFQRRASAGGSPFGPGGPGGYTAHGTGPIDLGDFFGSGGIDLGDLFNSSMNRGTSRTSSPRGKRASAFKGEDIRATVQVPFETAVKGGMVDVRIDRSGSIETLGVKIPAGVNDGQVIRLAGQGGGGSSSGIPGDLLLKVEVKPHPYFRREGANLLVDVPVSPSEAVLGTKVDVPTLSEGPVVVKIPPGTSSGMKLRLRGKGVIDSATKQPGDQFVVVKIVLPKKITEREKTLYEQIAEGEASVREGLW
ncbi:DnaJ C-terminal domain-containing protein [Schlesneria sp.]|uniref:DnaJ C-terminal domain-containing protein n=1 Tax=Schlesneria sp. TaxID=2762018 RepID=UPI002F0E0946